MFRWLVRCAFLLAGSSASAAAAPEELPPDLLLKRLTAEVIDIAKRSRGNFSGARGPQMEELVEHKIVPVFDFARMTERAVERNWRLATAEQRKSLITEFRTLLVRTYSVAIRNYRDETFEFKLLNPAAAAADATVRSVIKQTGSVRTTIDYDMQKSSTGWKVYEIRIDGVNLIANYRETFAARVRDAGVDGLIKALADRNRQSSYSGSGSGSPAAAIDSPA